ncbi:MAG: ABC transporter substrate-binding protein [Chloroflexi bacterium]|nr:ABC transporter substrate-binding protein [Chloroflexota bacterium]
MTRTLCVAAIVTAVVVVSLSACGKPAPQPPPTTAPAPAAPSSSPTAEPSPTAKPISSPSTWPLVDRQAQVEAAAKKEGKVVLWSPHAKLAPQFLAKFKERYPWLQLETWDATSTAIVEKLVSEAKVGRYSVDVISDGEQQVRLIPRDLLAKYDWPNAAKWASEGLGGTEGFYVRDVIGFYGPVYNSKLVVGADIPKTWNDIKDPKWKGKTSLALDGDEAPLMLAAMWGGNGKLAWEESFAFWREVSKNTKPKTVKGYTEPTRLLGAGEYALFIWGSSGVTLRAQTDGGLPVAHPPLDRFPGTAKVKTILKNAPHPNAARLLVDYITSTEGSRIYADVVGYTSLNPEAAGALANRRFKEIKVYIMPSELESTENMKKSADFWAALLGI